MTLTAPPLWQGRLEIRSVPLRGYGFEIKLYKGSTTTYADWFPSPCGDSPILASPVATGEVASNASRWGRLCLAITSVDMKIYSLRPWRPLRHTACATSPASAGEAGDTLRPLSGFWFLSKPTATVNSHRTGSFRLLAGSLYLSFPRRYEGSGEQREPIGALVACVHF